MNQKMFFNLLVLGALSTYTLKAMSEEIPNINLLSPELKMMKLQQEYSSGNYAKVVEDSKKLLLIDPANESVRELNALSNFKLKKYKAVIDLYKESQTPYLTSQVQLKLRAISQVRVGNYIQAMSAIRTLRSVTPVTPEWKAFYHYTVFKLNASSAFGELSRMSRATPNAANDATAGKLYILERKYDQAIASFNTALVKDAGNAEVLEMLGDIYFKVKNYDKAASTYGQLLSKQPNNSDLRIKTSKVLAKQGRYVDAIKVLDKDNRPEIVAYKEKVSIIANRILNGEVTRDIAEEKVEVNSITDGDGKLVLEEKFYPKEIDIYVDPVKVTEKEKPSMPEAVSVAPVPLVAPVLVVPSKDVSTLELGFSPKVKKYDLSGRGFNAAVDYSSGGALNLKYKFSPDSRSWNTDIELDHSRVELKTLSGITPDKIILSETQGTVGVSYLAGNFSVGPALMYKKTTVTQTSPSILRGDADYFNAGARAAYSFHMTDSLIFNIGANYFTKILASGKDATLGSVDSHSVAVGSAKFYFEMRPMAFIFLGASYASTNTQYKTSSGRGTVDAKEQETDVSFPVGINYAF